MRALPVVFDTETNEPALLAVRGRREAQSSFITPRRRTVCYLYLRTEPTFPKRPEPLASSLQPLTQTTSNTPSHGAPVACAIADA